MLPSSSPQPVRRREVAAWAFYDFANTSYSIVVITAVYSVYYTQVVAAGHIGEQLWGWGYASSMLVVALVSPVLGAVADLTARKKRFLCFFTGLCVLFTALKFFIEKGDVVWGLLFFAISNIGFAGGLVFYNAFLPEIARPDNMGRISAYGWAFGYVGGLASLAFVYPLLRAGFVDENLGWVRVAFPLTAVFFLLTSLPTFFILRERGRPGPATTTTRYLRVGWKRVLSTFREVRRLRELAKFLAAYFLYADGIHTIIIFVSVFGAAVLGFSAAELVIFFVVVQIAAVAGTALLGSATDRLGPRRTIAMTLLVWIAVVVAIYFVQSKQGFFVIGAIAGSVVGASLASSRALVALMTPPGREAEFFGFFSVSEKFAALLGPLVYGAVSAATGDQRKAFLAIGLFFVAGLFVLWFVREEKGIAAARSLGEGNDHGSGNP